MNYLENDTNENNNENNNDKQYSDKDIQVSTQLAYMDFDQKEVERYQHEVGDDTAYPTVQWMLTESENADSIKKKYLERYDYKEGDLSGEERNRKANELIDSIVCIREKWRYE